MLSLLLLSVLCGAAFAQESDVTYIEGWVDLKDSSGEIYELFIGDRVYTGDTVITGDDGLAELEPQSGSRIIIKPGTVFSITEREIGGRKQSVVSTTLGEVSFKFNKMTQEPMIATPATVAGVRGTEFTVYAGADGSSLIAVSSGAVEVSSKGRSVYLEPDEGVEVVPGEAPGEKFSVMGRELDFSSWNNGKIDAMMAAPASSLDNLSAQLSEMIGNAEEWAALHGKTKAELEKLRADMDALFADGKDDDARALYGKTIRPLENESLSCVKNLRYYALSALSLRQHVLSGFYIRMKTAYITDRDNPVYRDFADNYEAILSDFDRRLEGYLEDTDR